ncbi:hypothetical protein JKF63_02455 [Porcisia hertigi]|uniref:Uncharacterized protein n=1 Tax=Porcisia hertigi TaxID=2761500 RepID=A0A836HNQ1_9TRYP|nr:hypothetical protein JKF63_02455 [Porcisia hertigi]
MLVELATFVAVFVVCWYRYFRPRSTNQLRPSYESHHSTANIPPSDYVVIGGGAAGLAAAAELLRRTEKTSHILLIESGSDPQPASRAAFLLEVGRRDRLLSFSPDLVNVPPDAMPRGVRPTFLRETPDEGYLAQRPFHYSKADETTTAAPSGADGATLAAEESKVKRYRLLHYAPYPRGVGVGGTARLDWGMHMNSLYPATTEAALTASCPPPNTTQSCEKSLPQWARLPMRFAVLRSPLSWAFAEAVKTIGLAAPYHPTVSAPVKRGCVFPSYLYLDEDSRRLALASAVLGDIEAENLHSRLSVLTGYTAVGLDLAAKVGDGATERAVSVTGVQVCRSRGGAKALVTIPIGKGVVVAAGAIHSPRLLHTVGKHSALQVPNWPLSTVRVRDALALPLIFPALQAVSADSVNARDTTSAIRWWLTQRGPYLSPLCDTVLSLMLPQIAPQAEVRVVLFPFGGRDAARFTAMGWDTILGTPLQAFTMLLIVQGIDGLEHTLALEDEASPIGSGHAHALTSHQALCPLSEEVHRKVQDAFLVGIKECRRLSQTQPLASLALEPGVESTDFTLLVPDDESKAVRLARLSRVPPWKRSARGKSELKELLRWSHHVTRTEEYMRRYVDAHAYWLGFASGTSEAFLASSSTAPSSSRVEGLRNAVVGDSSAVTTAQWSGVGKRDTLAAGSRSTGMDAAVRAVAELVKICGPS